MCRIIEKLRVVRVGLLFIGLLPLCLAIPASALNCTIPSGVSISSCDNPILGISLFNDVALQNPILGGCVVSGQTIYVQLKLQQSPGGCALTGGVMVVSLPGSGTSVGTDVTPASGVPIICAEGIPVGCPADAVGFVLSGSASYQVNVNAINKIPTNTIDGGMYSPPTSIPAPCVAGTPTNWIEVVGVATARLLVNGCGVGAQNAIRIPVLIPAMQVTKLVQCSTDTVCSATSDGPFSVGNGFAGTAYPAWGADGNHTPFFCYQITITNTGTAIITITNVTDSVLGNLSTTPSLLTVLNPGDSITAYTVSPIETDQTTDDTVTVLAVENNSGLFFPLSATASAHADVYRSHLGADVIFTQNNQPPVPCPNPPEDCPNAVFALPTAPVAITVCVTNEAQNGQAMTNIVIRLDGAPGSPITKTVPGPLAIGGVACVEMTTVSAVTCYNLSAAVSAQGVLTDGCGPITNGVAKNLRICGTPEIKVHKFVKSLQLDECLPGGNGCSVNLVDYHHSDTGAVNAGFCYAIVVTNTGDLVLNNIQVQDSVLSTQAQPNQPDPLVTPFSLAPGTDRVIFTGQEFYPGVIGQVVNTVSASGTTDQGTAVQDQSTASVDLLRVSIRCHKFINDREGGMTISLPGLTACTDLVFTVTVENDGDVDLENIQVSDSGQCADQFEGGIVTVLGYLPAHSTSDVIPLCTTNVCCLPASQTFSDTVYVEGTVSNSNGVDRVNSLCQLIKTNNQCSASVTIQGCATPGCRTTGGGKQPSNNTCPVVKYVTHGGQVGAPFDMAGAPTLDCETGLGSGFFNPCIRGEFQHVRHIKGGLRGTFHAASNGKEHDFDSLICGCLPCDHVDVLSPWGGCHPADRTYAAENPTVPGKHHALCNPGDRVCGPEPRKAPANKICFSGVGDYALNKGKKTENKVVFRVEIEDRSEPGGAHPKGGTPPPDRYRMRMWIIDPSAVDSLAVKELRVAVACKDSLTEVVDATLQCGGPTPEPDIDDGGDLDRGNRQIHPNTGATCND